MVELLCLCEDNILGSDGKHFNYFHSLDLLPWSFPCLYMRVRQQSFKIRPFLPPDDSPPELPRFMYPKHLTMRRQLPSFAYSPVWNCTHGTGAFDNSRSSFPISPPAIKNKTNLGAYIMYVNRHYIH